MEHEVHLNSTSSLQTAPWLLIKDWLLRNARRAMLLSILQTLWRHVAHNKRGGRNLELRYIDNTGSHPCLLVPQ